MNGFAAMAQMAAQRQQGQDQIPQNQPATNQRTNFFDRIENGLRNSVKYIGNKAKSSANWLCHHPLTLGVTTLTILGAIAIDSYLATKKVYEGKVGEWNVAYYERDALFSDRNTMFIRKGQELYRLFDEENPTKINWRNSSPPVLSDDKLERVIYVTPQHGTQEFYITDINEGTIKGTEAKRVFDNANNFYNLIREEARTNLRRENQVIISKARDGFKIKG